uniref:LIM zinc-binding domain-containing protein n=1 Tax=Anopheles christyi TaxID=43041 RepID=A0A182JZS5_9DIPT
MWKCHKCGKPVFFAERKQSLGYDWHPECLRCEECGKRLNPGQHAEHKGVPYCHVPCYGALFGPQLFGHGTRVESHKSFGQPDQKKQAIQRSPAGPVIPKGHLESKLKLYNQFHNNKSMEIRSREVNGRLVLEGALRIYWGVQGMIHLKEDDDQRTVVTVRKRNSYRQSTPASLAHAHVTSDGEEGDEKENIMHRTDQQQERRGAGVMGVSTSSLTEPGDSNNDTTTISESISYDTLSLSSELNSNFDSKPVSSSESSKEVSPSHAGKYVTLPPKLDVKQLDWDEIDELLQVERKLDESEKLYRTMPSPLATGGGSGGSGGDRSLASESVTDTDYKTLTPNTATGSSGRSEGGSGDSDQTTTGGPDTSASVTTSVTTNGDDDFRTPEATLRSHDFEAFKMQISREFISSTAEMGNTDGTLKQNQPIDPARINDSLKLYNDGVMNRSLSDEQCRNAMFSLPAGNITGSFHVESGANEEDDTTLRHPANGIYASPNHDRQSTNGTPKKRIHLQRPTQPAASDAPTSSEATTNGGVTSPGTDTDSWTADRGLLRSKSQGNHYSGNSFMDSDVDDDSGGGGGTGSETLKPSDKPQSSIHIRMDCYDELESPSSAVGFTPSEDGELTAVTATTLTTTTATTQPSEYSTSISGHPVTDDGVVLRKPPKTGSTAIKRRSGNRRSRTKLKRRCSINGHFYNRETSFFTPPYGSQMNVWVTSLVNTQEVINLLLEKYKVESKAENFTLFIVRDNGEQKKLKDDDYPLVTRVILGPHEDIAKLFLMDGQQTQEIRFAELRKRIIQRMESLKVRL